MRGVIMFIGIVFAVLGFLMVIISAKSNLSINYTAFTAAAFGLALIVSGIIICLLTVIIIELKKINNPRTCG